MSRHGREREEHGTGGHACIRLGVGWIWWVVALGAGRLAAEEPAAAFLNALRDKQYNDAALRVSGPHGSRSADTGGVPPGDPVAARHDDDSGGGAGARSARCARRRSTSPRRIWSDSCGSSRTIRRIPRRGGSSAFCSRAWARIKVEQAARTSEATMRKEAAGLYDQAYQVFDSAVTELQGQLTKLKEQPDMEAAGGGERATAVAPQRIPRFVAAAGRNVGGQGRHGTGGFGRTQEAAEGRHPALRRDVHQVPQSPVGRPVRD